MQATPRAADRHSAARDRAPHVAPRQSPLRTAACWIAALAVMAALLAWTGYRTRDPDSRAYIAIAARLAAEPVERWIAPQWWGAWGRHGPFREHPAGTFVLPAALARAGYPAAQASFVVSLAMQVISLLLLAGLAARLLPRPEARLIVWALPLLPIAFVFRVRANQEYLLLAGLLLALYATERARDRAAWAPAAIAGFAWALAVKGVFALLAPVLCALWLLLRRERRWQAWLAPAGMVLLTPAAAVLYERGYTAVAGGSFLEYYLGPRIGLEDAPSAVGLPFPVNKIGNAAWYAGRLAWYAAPWSLVLAAYVAATRGRAADGRAHWIRFAALAAAAIVLLVAARDLTADRYVFPAYFLAGAGGLAAACARWPRFAALGTGLDRWWPWGPPLLWVALTGGRVLMG